ncbi:MAG: DNA-binding response regulator [Gammaproteobacteria bacterium]|nr:MAG: DNA-binding response regulator [Gammaproteobacteria bacterium]
MHTDTTPLLLVDDDSVFCRVMADALEKRGFSVHTAQSVEEGMICYDRLAPKPDHAIVDLNMPGQNGLVLVQFLAAQNPGMRIIVLTGYASIPTTIEAIKLGATYYLAKPAHADDIVAAFSRSQGTPDTDIGDMGRSLQQVEWDHIQEVLKQHDGNISATARALGMHRRTLQRKLQKRVK